MSERRPVPKLRLPRKEPLRQEHKTPAETPNLAEMLKQALEG